MAESGADYNINDAVFELWPLAFAHLYEGFVFGGSNAKIATLVNVNIFKTSPKNKAQKPKTSAVKKIFFRRCQFSQKFRALWCEGKKR